MKRGFAVVTDELAPVAGFVNPFDSWEEAQEYVWSAERHGEGEKLSVAVRCADGGFLFCPRDPATETEAGSERSYELD